MMPKRMGWPTARGPLRLGSYVSSEHHFRTESWPGVQRFDVAYGWNPDGHLKRASALHNAVGTMASRYDRNRDSDGDPIAALPATHSWRPSMAKTCRSIARLPPLRLARKRRPRRSWRRSQRSIIIIAKRRRSSSITTRSIVDHHHRVAVDRGGRNATATLSATS